AFERRVDPAIEGTKLAQAFPRIFETEGVDPGSVEFEPRFLEMLEASIPVDVKKSVDHTISEAKRLAAEGMAPPFPIEDEAKIRLALYYSWAHSRDMTVIMSALGYPLASTGRHDIQEYVKGSHIKTLAEAADAPAWLKKYAATLGADEQVNISFMNPVWIAGIWEFKIDAVNGPNAKYSMAAHFLSDHHRGTPEKSPDPFEAAVNALF